MPCVVFFLFFSSSTYSHVVFETPCTGVSNMESVGSLDFLPNINSYGEIFVVSCMIGTVVGIRE